MERLLLLQKVAKLPKVPGVYIYRNSKRKVIYVGKAISLKDRVTSYFVPGLAEGTKTKALVADIDDLSYIEVQSELEALILEAELIKRYDPKYNISLKDDKSYKYIAIKQEKVDGLLLPTVSTLHVTKNYKPQKSLQLFGPFPEGQTVNFVIRSIRKIFPYRDCSLAKYTKYKKIGAPCLYGHIGLCSAPCVGKISPDGYRKLIGDLKKYLSGDSKKVLKSFESQMFKASARHDFEEAAYYRDILHKYKYVTQKAITPGAYIENPNLVEDLREDALMELSEVIPDLKLAPQRIECYDIANISGKSATASMVVALNGKLVHSEYRRFKVKTKELPDDFEMMREVLRRRFSLKNLKDGWSLPDLVVVDGGSGQVSAALEVLKSLGISIPLIGLAKKFETVVYKNDEGFEEVSLSRDSKALKLLQSLRDEAHRFARRYHHLLRLKSLKS